MSTMTRVDYPTENGVEVRTMGLSLRPIRLYYELKDIEEGDESSRYHVSLTGRMFAVDLEDQNQLIPGLGRVIFDPNAVRGMIGGRLERLTTDVVITDPEHPFKKGYMRQYGAGPIEPRPVSEPFMLFSVVTLGKEQFEEQRATADANFQKQNPQATKGAWD